MQIIHIQIKCYLEKEYMECVIKAVNKKANLFIYFTGKMKILMEILKIIYFCCRSIVMIVLSILTNPSSFFDISRRESTFFNATSKRYD